MCKTIVVLFCFALLLSLAAAGLAAPITAVASGGKSTLVLRSDGTVWTWGPYPTQVVGLSDIVGIAAGGNMFGAVESDGTLWVWGSNYNTYAGIGTGPGSSSTSPIRVTSLSGYRITAVSLSGTHGMALQDDGSVWTWGSNGSGQLGDRTSTDAYWPLKISSFTEVQSISAGGYCSAALKTDGTLWMWGEGSGYQFGQGYLMNDNCGTPISVPITGVAAVANNGHTPMALKTDGTVWTWGGSDYSPVQISGLSGITMIDNGSAKLAVGTDGAVWSWGSNTHGQLGDGTTVDKAAPALIPGMSGAAMVAAGNNFSVIVKSDDTVWACGHNDAGQLGNGRAPRRSLPCPVPGLADVVSVAMGYRNAAAVKSNGTVWTWGDNGGGCLGDGTNVNRNVPIQVPGLSGAVSVVAAGWAAVLALKSDGTVWGWGTNTSGQVGDGSRTQRKSPVQVTISNVRALSAADEFVVALKNDGTVWAWGDNQYGQLGDGTATTRTSPVQVQGLSNVVAVAAGGKTTMALKSDGTLWGCGANDRNQLGLAACDYVAHKTVSQITVIDNVAAVALPSGNVAVTKRDGSVWVWGNNGYYDLGDPTGTSHYQPWQAPLFSGSTSIVGTNRHMMAIRSDGTLLACGREDEGVLGRGSSAPSQSPWPVRGITGVTAGAVGWYNALAIRDDSTVWAWGENAYGQLGDGYLEKVTTLTQVLFDAAVPTGSVTINGGAASTASASVTLVLSASDTGGPIPYVCISNDGVFDTEPWEDYYGSKTWTLSGGDGAKTVCVRYKDFAGNESETTTASIVLDALPPSISSFVVTPALAAEGDAVHVSVDAIDGNGVASVTSPEVALTKTGATTWTGDLTAASGLTAHEISVTASGGYGHTSTQTGSYKTAPVVALANGRPSDQILPLKTAAWLFKVYGRVENLSGSTFDLNTGVGTPVRVTAPGCSGISNGDFVTARGILNSTATPPTLASEGAYIHKHN